MRQLSTEWFVGIDPAKKQTIEAAIRNSTPLVRQLNLVLDKWEEELTSAESKITDYDTPAWDVRQAHRNGDRARIRKLRDLLSFLKETK
jgi:hypothetical protein